MGVGKKMGRGGQCRQTMDTGGHEMWEVGYGCEADVEGKFEIEGRLWLWGMGELEREGKR